MSRLVISWFLIITLVGWAMPVLAESSDVDDTAVAPAADSAPTHIDSSKLEVGRNDSVFGEFWREDANGIIPFDVFTMAIGDYRRTGVGGGRNFYQTFDETGAPTSGVLLEGYIAIGSAKDRYFSQLLQLWDVDGRWGYDLPILNDIPLSVAAAGSTTLNHGRFYYMPDAKTQIGIVADGFHDWHELSLDLGLSWQKQISKSGKIQVGVFENGGYVNFIFSH
jgi:hypothetical protein